VVQVSALDGVTISLPPCDQHPPLARWPMRNLIFSSCPACGHAVPREVTWRMVRARQLIRERGL
jgi:Zn ribbon nucleic-acid-binding protein